MCSDSPVTRKAAAAPESSATASPDGGSPTGRVRVRVGALGDVENRVLRRRRAVHGHLADEVADAVGVVVADFECQDSVVHHIQRHEEGWCYLIF